MTPRRAWMRRALKRLSWLVALGMIVVPTVRAEADGVVGAKKGKVYHTHPDDCSAAKNINDDNIVRWASESEAKKEGRRLCKSCAKLDERAKKKAAGPSDTERPANSRRPSAAESEEPENVDNSGGSLIQVRVKKVLTGGTVLLDNGDKARLFGIAAPQSGQSLADETIRFIEKRVKGRTLQLIPVEDREAKPRRDRLGRTLAYIAISSGDSDLGGALVNEGLAAVDRSIEFERLDDYLKHEDDAAWAGRGIWKKLDGPEGAAEVVTGKHTHEYHAADCPHVEHLIEPATVTVNEAKSRRLRPCEYYRVGNGKKN
ncbi:MAG TPA: thermonuclease family protein [Phycisphaerae bacterium]|nr:thermonuclease family protein [Phycisphaerae bacterium]